MMFPLLKLLPMLLLLLALKLFSKTRIYRCELIRIGLVGGKRREWCVVETKGDEKRLLFWLISFWEK